MSAKTAVKLGNWTDDPAYYVTVVDAGRVGYLAGPFRTHEGALAAVDKCQELAYEADPYSHFYAFGTAKRPNGYREGLFNAKLRPDGLWTGHALVLEGAK